jgi:FkbM family methyltransferase
VRSLDVAVWKKLPGVEWQVRVRLVRHASYFILSGGVEPSIFALFCAIGQQFGIESFWDVGANVGYYSWLTKSIASKAEVRMFEPDPDNLALIRETIRRARLSGVALREVAVSDRIGRKVFIRDAVSGSTGGVEEPGSTYSEREWGLRGSKIMVNSITLDAEWETANPPDLIKIDVEGHEEAVIRGACDLIRSCEPIIIVECFHGGGEICGFLSNLGYWLGDADRFVDDLTHASNFLAVPRRWHDALPSLKTSWSREMKKLSS